MKKRIELSFDLTEFILKHPELKIKTSDRLVIYVENDQRFNISSKKIENNLIKKGLGVLKAVRKQTTYNKWLFI